MKKISIVIPCYNATNYLERCMKHILNQTIGIENIEIIMVNDASTDNGATWNLIAKYESQYPNNIIAINLEENLRQGGARNVGVSYATGEYLMFCDADDWLALPAMEILYETAEEEGVDVLEFGSKIVYSYKDENEKIEYGNQSYLWDLSKEAVKKNIIMGSMDDFTLGCWNKIYRLSLVQDNHIRFAEQLICEEPSFTLPVRMYEKKHMYLDKKLYYYFQTPNSTVHSSWDKRKWDNLNVWKILMKDLIERGFLQIFHEELECMFYDWGLGLTMRMLLQKGYVLTKDELIFLRQQIIELFPNVLENFYINDREDGWNEILKTVLTIDFTEENVLSINKIMRQYLEMYSQLSNQQPKI